MDPPNYCHAVDIETLEWIKRRNRDRDSTGVVTTILSENCPPREILSWMLDNQIEDFSLEQAAQMGYYDIVSRCQTKSQFFPDYPDYNVLCWEIDTGKKLSYYNRSIIPCLVGGRKRYIEAVTASTDGGADVSEFVCRNTYLFRKKVYQK